MSQSGANIIKLPAHMDLAATERVLSELLAAHQANTSDKIGIDIGHVTEMSTPALQLLLSACAYTQGLTTKMIGMSDTHRQMFTKYGVADELLGVSSA
jgi:anti-anti-sigma regulatory factor